MQSNLEAPIIIGQAEGQELPGHDADLLNSLISMQ